MDWYAFPHPVIQYQEHALILSCLLTRTRFLRVKSLWSVSCIAFNTFALGVEVECDSLAEVSSSFAENCFVCMKWVGVMHRRIRASITMSVISWTLSIPIFPPSHPPQIISRWIETVILFLFLEKVVQKALKKCNEFPELFGQMTVIVCVLSHV